MRPVDHSFVENRDDRDRGGLGLKNLGARWFIFFAVLLRFWLSFFSLCYIVTMLLTRSKDIMSASSCYELPWWHRRFIVFPCGCIGFTCCYVGKCRWLSTSSRHFVNKTVRILVYRTFARENDIEFLWPINSVLNSSAASQVGGASDLEFCYCSPLCLQEKASVSLWDA